jgi:iron-sulfur cluster assembly accessory protein
LINITDNAVEKIKYFIEKKGTTSEIFFRVGATPGGCSGLKYKLVFDNKIDEKDIATKFGEVTVLVDSMSAPYLEGMTIDFADTIEKQGFTIDNPNASNSCACGSSFS